MASRWHNISLSMRNNFYWAFQQPVRLFQKSHSSLWWFTRITKYFTDHCINQLKRTCQYRRKVIVTKGLLTSWMCRKIYFCRLDHILFLLPWGLHIWLNYIMPVMSHAKIIFLVSLLM